MKNQVFDLTEIQGCDTMCMHPQSSDSAYTFLTGILQENNLCKGTRKARKLNLFLNSSLNIPNALKQLFLVSWH